MSDEASYVKLPPGLSDHSLTLVPSSLDEDEFVAHQVEFVRHIFGYCAYLAEHGRETAVSDAFLSVFVNLFDVMDSNVPCDARLCAGQLMKVLYAIFPDVEMNGTPAPLGTK